MVEGGQLRLQKDSNWAWGTHFLEMAEGWTSQNMDTKITNQAKGHSHPGNSRERDKSEHGRKQLREGHSHPGDGRRRDKLRHGKKATKKGALTYWRWQMDRHVRT